MNVKLLNVKYSPNVGDGLLVECLETQLRSVDGMEATSSVDLAGRTAHPSAPSTRRETMMRVLDALPTAIRPHFARAGLSARLALGLRDHYRRELAGATAVVVGGGNLLSDQDLNFPMKIVAALGEAARIDARVAIYGCGVASHWSRAGRKMVCAALAAHPPVATTVRDAASKQAWDMHFSAAAGSEARIVHDPGILASTVHRFEAPAAARARPVVAVGLMSSLAIRYHGFESLSEADLTAWYLALVDEMVAAGFDVCLFTNGSPEDRRFAEGLWKGLSTHPSLGRIRLAEVQVPADLCRAIFMADVVVAFRMHALIAAYSYGRPFVALKWDAKVDAFIRSVGLAQEAVDVGIATPAQVAGQLVGSLGVAADAVQLEGAMARARGEIRQLALALQPPGSGA